MKKEWLEVCGIILIATYMMFFRLGEIPLLDPDEPVYAQTAAEMLAQGDFVSPRIYGDYWYDKPPMYYWMVAGTTYAFGQTEFAARLPSALMALAGVMLLYFIGKTAFGQRAGWIAALVLATSVEYFYLGKAAVTDMTLVFFFSAALFAYARQSYLTMYACMGLAVLTKGPVGAVLPVLIILLHLAVTKEFQKIRELRIFLGLAIVLAVAAPWYLLMYHLHGMDFINTFLGFHNITRFLQPEHASGTKLYYYLPVLIVGFFPWIVYLGQAVNAGLRSRKSAEGNFLLLLLIWFGAVFIFFSLSQTKLVSYILPMYPPMALLIGWYIDGAVERQSAKGFLAGTAGLSIIGALMAGALTVLAHREFGEVPEGVWHVAAVLGAMALLSIYANYKKKAMLHFMGLVAGMMCFCGVLMTEIFPMAANFVSVKAVAAVFNREFPVEGGDVYVDKFLRPGFCYYTGVAGQEIGGRFTSLLDGKGSAYFLIRGEQYDMLPVKEQVKLLILRKQANMVLLYKS